MQTEYIVLAQNAPVYGEVIGDRIVINVSGKFPEQGFSYSDMRAGLCRAYVRVTEESVEES